MSPLGVLHPLFVHFPFALVVTAALLEAWARRRDRTVPSPHTAPLLLIAAVGALFAAGSGWLAASGRTGTDDLLTRIAWHRWLGIASVVVIGAAAALFRPKEGAAPRDGRLTAARAFLALSFALVAVGGHLGAELTHGRETYLDALDRLLGRDPTTRGADAADRRSREAWVDAALSDFSVPSDRPIDYEGTIQPILIRHCWPCHGAEKVRGGLRLDSRDRAILGGDSGEALVPGNARESSLWVRCVEDSEEFPRMPEDAPALPETLTAALERWIEEGAPWPEPEPTPWRRTE